MIPSVQMSQFQIPHPRHIDTPRPSPHPVPPYTPAAPVFVKENVSSGAYRLLSKTKGHFGCAEVPTSVFYLHVMPR